MKYTLALLVVISAALPARTAPALKAGAAPVSEDQASVVLQRGREKKSYQEERGDAQPSHVAGAPPCAGAALGHGGIGLAAGQGLLAPVPLAGYYGLRPWGYGGIGAGLGNGYGQGYGAGAHYRNLLEQRDTIDNNQFEMRSATEMKNQENQAEARSAIGGFGYGGLGGGALGVFPGAVGGGCGAIPLLVSCTPNLVAGHIIQGGYGHGHGGFGYGGGLYRAASEASGNNNMEQQKVISPAPPAAAPSPAHGAAPSLAHAKTLSSSSRSFQQRQSSSTVHHVGGVSAGKPNSLPA